MPAKGYKCGQYKFSIAEALLRSPAQIHPEFLFPSCTVLRFPPECVCLIFITLTNGVAHLSQNPFLRSVPFGSEKIWISAYQTAKHMRRRLQRRFAGFAALGKIQTSFEHVF